MRCLDLFSGIGGFALACEWAGIETAAFCEIEPYCQAVLRKHWPNIPIHPDIRTLKGGDFEEIDLICGGFPCQPYSVAGKRRGAADDRDLWPEMRRVIAEFKPRWVCAENTPGFIGIGLDQMLDDLEALDYETGAVVLPAGAIGAPHYRARLFMVAHTDSPRLEGIHDSGHRIGVQLPKARLRDEWEAEPNVDRVAIGIPHRVDRLKALGNAVVPMQVLPILKAIVDYERTQSPSPSQ